MVAVKLLDLKDECQGWQLKARMKNLVFLPGRVGRYARQWVAKVAGARDMVELVATLGATSLAGTRNRAVQTEPSHRLNWRSSHPLGLTRAGERYLRAKKTRGHTKKTRRPLSSIQIPATSTKQNPNSA